MKRTTESIKAIADEARRIAMEARTLEIATNKAAFWLIGGGEYLAPQAIAKAKKARAWAIEARKARAVAEYNEEAIRQGWPLK